MVVAGTSFNTDTYHQTRPYCQLCGTVHPALRSPDRATRHPHSHTRDAQTVVRTERTPLIETPGSDPCSTVPRSTAGDSRSAAACTVVGGEGRQPAAGAAKACRPRRRPSWREGSWWARQVRERADERADGPCRCGCYPWGRPYAGCGDARDARAASGCLRAGRALAGWGGGALASSSHRRRRVDHHGVLVLVSRDEHTERELRASKQKQSRQST